MLLLASCCEGPLLGYLLDFRSILAVYLLFFNHNPRPGARSYYQHILIGQLFYICYKSVSLPGNCLYVLMSVAGLAQCFPQRGDILCQIVLLHDRVGPDLLHQLISMKKMSAVLDERQKYLERLWRERHRLSVSQQQALCCVQAEGAEFV